MSAKEIFIATVGETPQIITEAIYHFYSSDKPRVFDEIHAITTLLGAKKINEFLFEKNILENLKKDIGFKGEINFNQSNIHILTDQKGKELDDIRDTNESAGEMISLFETVKSLTMDKESRVTATVAGGRKTMSVAMGLAMQVYGREQDELIHILVPTEKFNDDTWFYPKGKTKIEVMQLPYYRIRNIVGNVENRDPKELIQLSSQMLTRSELSLKVEAKKDGLYYSGNTLRLSPWHITLWVYLAKRKLKANCDEGCGGCEDCFASQNDMMSDYKSKIADIYHKIKDYDQFDIDDSQEEINSRDSFEIDDDLRKKRSQLKSSVKKKIMDLRLLGLLTVSDIKVNDINYFGLALRKNQINILL